MFAEERKLKIFDFLTEHKKATVAELVSYFKVSNTTVRNDLREMERDRLLIRTHGGAMLRTRTGYEPDPYEKQIKNVEEKKRIALVALDLIDDGDTIILDTGTTTMELALLLARKKNLRVITNDLLIALLLEDNANIIDILFIGGIIRKKYHCTLKYRNASAEMLTGLTVDKAFITANGFSHQKGGTTPDIGQAEIKTLLMAAASTVVVLCDGSKIGDDYFIQFATVDQVDKLVTDRMEPREKETLEEMGLDVVIAPQYADLKETLAQPNHSTIE
jgi:DeoR family transcriptional regulator, fructose operon transcriptional repressor